MYNKYRTSWKQYSEKFGYTNHRFDRTNESMNIGYGNPQESHPSNINYVYTAIGKTRWESVRIFHNRNNSSSISEDKQNGLIV